jgi:hypothetical protein
MSPPVKHVPRRRTALKSTDDANITHAHDKVFGRVNAVASADTAIMVTYTNLILMLYPYVPSGVTMDLVEMVSLTEKLDGEPDHRHPVK